MMTTDSNQVTGSPAFPIHKVAALERNPTPSKMTLEDLLTETRQYMTAQDMEKIRAGYELAKKAHNGAVRRSGEPYIQHPLEVAFLLAGMRIDAAGIVAALLHDVVEDTDYALEDLRAQFGPAVATIVDAVTKFETLTLPAVKVSERGDGTVSSLPIDKQRQRIETVRKMLVAMAEDPRVVVLKLADRLHNMRTLGAMNPTQQQNTARETSEIYAPLARRLGMAPVQAELEDLALSYLEPERYQWLAQVVAEEIERRRPYVEKVCRTLHKEMQGAGIAAEIHAWQKHLASVNRKLGEMVRPNQSDAEINRVYDLVSYRILVDSDHQCYLGLGHIHALWRPKDGRIKDFIATPKQNGYQSLHTTVFCLDDQLADIQLRTHEMQRTADYGIASYWYLRERMGKDQPASKSWRLSYHEMKSWMEQLRQLQGELPQQSANEFVEAVKDDIFQEQIFVFTPKGEVKDLPLGSTPLDFAYRIHTDLGDHCAGARIITNQDDTGRLTTRIVPLDYELKGGEIVDILRDRTVHPTRDWLSFARTTAARTKIRRYLKTYEREINLQIGRERLDLALKAASGSGLVDETEAILQTVYQTARASSTSPLSALKKYSSLDDLYIALGREDLHTEQVMELLTPSLRQRVIPGRAQTAAHHYSNSAEDAQSGGQEQGQGQGQGQGGQSGVIVKLASCCCPIPGDTIVGVLQVGKGMMVHRVDCRALRRPRKNAKTLLEVNWLQIEPESYLVPVMIVAHDRSGLLRDVASVVADANINMASVTSVTQPSLQKATITAILEIGATDTLGQVERIFRRLRQVKNVVNVERALSSR